MNQATTHQPLDVAITNRRFQSVLDRALARQRELQPTTQPITEPTALPIATVAQVPLWDTDQRGFPNHLARSALFTAAKDDDRGYRRGETVAALQGIDIVYTGEELRQDDASVIMTILHMARGQALHEPIVTTKFALLKTLGRSINSREYDNLRTCLTRLKATEIRLQADAGAMGYAGSFLRNYEWANAEEGDTKLRLWLDPKIANMFQKTSYTRLNWEQRRALGQKAPLAQWLHSFLATHEQPLPIKVETYHKLSASKAKNMYDFRDRLKLALSKLQHIGFLTSFEVHPTTNLVYVKRA